MNHLLIGLLGLVMGVVTSISGGAGVFAVPTMLAFGVPPLQALALNRMSDVGVVFGALRKYHTSKSVDWRLACIAMLPLAVGSFLGANTVIRLPEAVLSSVIIVGVLVGIIFILKPIKVKDHADGGKMTPLKWFVLTLVGFWSGALGMAGATFAVIIFVYFFKKIFLQARATDIIAAIPETVISAMVLAWGAGIASTLLLSMFASSFLGAWIGSHLAVKHGDGFIRRAMVVIAVVMIVKVVLGL